MHYIINIKYINHSFINVSYNLTKFMRRNLTHKFNLVHAWSRDESICSSAIGSKIRRTGSRPVNRLPIRFAWDKKCTKKYTRETQGENWKEGKTRFPVRFAYVGKRDLFELLLFWLSCLRILAFSRTWFETCVLVVGWCALNDDRVLQLNSWLERIAALLEDVTRFSVVRCHEDFCIFRFERLKLVL